MTSTKPLMKHRMRSSITHIFRFLEDVIFVGLGVLLAACALYLFCGVAIQFGHQIYSLDLNTTAVVELIEKLLLILLVVEILYTVQVSFRQHSLAAEPFLLIGLIAAVRRVLVITAELAEKSNQSEEIFRFLMIELGVLTILILCLVISVMLLRKRPTHDGSADA